MKVTEILKTEWPTILCLISILGLSIGLAGCSSENKSTIGPYGAGFNSSVGRSGQESGTWNQPPHGGIDEKSSTSPGCADK